MRSLRKIAEILVCDSRNKGTKERIGVISVASRNFNSLAGNLRKLPRLETISGYLNGCKRHGGVAKVIRIIRIIIVLITYLRYGSKFHIIDSVIL